MSPAAAVTEERLQHFLYNKHGLMRLGTVGVTVSAVVGLVHSLNKVPENAGPAIIRAVLFMVLPLVLQVAKTSGRVHRL